MKKFILYIILFAFFASAPNAVFGQEFLVGPKAGIQYYKVRFAEKDVRKDLEAKSQLGYKAGGTIIFPLEKDFSFGSEFYYSKKGRKYIYEGTTNNTSRYQFLEFSAFLRKSYPIRFGENTLPGKWFFNVGPNIMYWMNGKGKISDAAEINYEVIFSEPADADYKKNYITDANRWLFGLDFGAGFSFAVRNSKVVFVELRYTYGHTFLGKEDSSVISIMGYKDDLRAQYRVLNLSVSYLFDVNLRNLRKGKSTIRPNRR